MASESLVSVDYDVTDLRVTACATCPSWYAEVARAGGMLVLREWHRPDCPVVLDLGSDDPRRQRESPSPDVQRAVGVVMAVYGLSSDAARLTLRLRASLVALPVEALAAHVLDRAASLHVETATRRRASDLFDDIGA